VIFELEENFEEDSWLFGFFMVAVMSGGLVCVFGDCFYDFFEGDC